MRVRLVVWCFASLAMAGEPRYRIDVDPAPEPSGWSQFHNWRVRVRAPYGFAPRLREFRFACRSTVLNRPPAIHPRITEIGPGLFLAQDVRFDLPGEWEVEVRVRDDDGWHRATRRVRTGQEDLLDHLRALAPDRGSRFDRFASALLEGIAPEPGSRLTEEELSGLRLYLGPQAGCARCHEKPPARSALPKGHGDHLAGDDRAGIEAFLRTLDPPARLE